MFLRPELCCLMLHETSIHSGLCKTFVPWADCLCYVRFWSLLLHRILVASTLRGTLPQTLVASATSNVELLQLRQTCRRFCYLGLVLFAMLPLLRSSLLNRFSPRAPICIAFKQVLPNSTHLYYFQTNLDKKYITTLTKWWLWDGEL